ncbi:lactonase family protein [Plantactinospora sp. GCM10030261]|uniref:lactonase family protein n=1 Tax=Plantactinospora sp. GCM10030261 TaxID=3273420 RepID=UPI00361D8685
MRGSVDVVHIGCYTAEGGGRGEGIVAARRDPDSGALDVLGTVATTPSPSFLARHPTLPVLYAVNEVSEGTVSAWTVGAGGRLTALGVRATGGEDPCHLAVDPAGRHLFVANYGSGSVTVLPLDPAGAPGERTDLLVHHGHGSDPERQESPHVHMVAPDGAGLYAVDLGTDAVYRYELDVSSGRLVPGGRTTVGAGTGPRHLARHPDGRRWYLTGELDRSVAVLDRDGTGRLHERTRLPASERTGHVQPAEIVVDRDGRRLYVSNRGVGTVAVYDLSTDEPPQYRTEVDTGGEWPRHFALLDQHLYVADERAHQVVGFVVDPVTGVPARSGEPVEVPSPTCVVS